jgi:hypothetical protein
LRAAFEALQDGMKDFAGKNNTERAPFSKAFLVVKEIP